jgi:hypothetical protein
MADANGILRAWRRLWNSGEAVDSAGLNRTALGPLVALYDGWIAQRYNNGTANYRSGTAQPGALMAVKGAGGDRQVTVNEGLAFISLDEVGSASGSVSAFEGPRYVPAFIPSPVSFNVEAHDSDPRIDTIYVSVAEVDDQTATRRIRMAGIGSQASDDLETRRRYVTTVAAVKGTPGPSPVAPAVPTGGMKIAEAHVPASSGAIVVKSRRSYLRPSSGGIPYHGIGLPSEKALGRPTSLALVDLFYPGGMTIRPFAGPFGINATILTVATETLTVPTADPSNPRIDLVYVDGDGYYKLRAGTPAADPVAPAVGYNEAEVAFIYVAAGATSISSGDVTNTSLRGHIGPENHTRVPVRVRARIEASGTTRVLSLGVVTPEGAGKSLQYVARIRVWDSEATLPTSSSGTGTARTAILGTGITGTVLNAAPNPASEMWIRSNSSGAVQVTLEGASAGTHVVVIEPMRYVEAAADRENTHPYDASLDPCFTPIYMTVTFP